MVYKTSLSRKLFSFVNVIVLISVTLIGILPFIHLLSVSLSSNVAAMSAEVKLWPVGFTFEAYTYLSQKVEFLRSIRVSVLRVVLGTFINMMLVIMTAYPLSKSNEHFRYRTAYVWFFAITMFFSGGLIPTFIFIKETGLMNSIWALVIPGALNVWYTVLLLNFFRGIPKDLEEAATIDGASQWAILWRIYLPVSLPALATILLFAAVGHWNAWFDGILYMNSPEKYPLQSYLSTLVMSIQKQAVTYEDIAMLKLVSEKTLRTAQIFLGALPIMLVYPFLQKYFIKGITVGSVKE